MRVRCTRSLKMISRNHINAASIQWKHLPCGFAAAQRRSFTFF
jgi:hypothetical protein